MEPVKCFLLTERNSASLLTRLKYANYSGINGSDDCLLERAQK